jgi:hypothetical protein
MAREQLAVAIGDVQQPNLAERRSGVRVAAFSADRCGARWADPVRQGDR